jgi:hypothetical protein
MAKIKDAEVKRVVSAIKARPSPWRTSQARRVVSKNRRAIGKMVETALSKTGLDVGKIDKLLAQDQKEMRGLFAKENAAAAKHFSAAQAEYRQAMATRMKVSELLATPFTSTLITLDKPFLIWQLPHPELDIFIDQHIEPNNSWIKLLIDTNAGSDYTQFLFYFLWENESDFFAVVNASSLLVVNGACEVMAAPGIFSGDTADFNMNASLTTMRWSGWGTNPATGHSNDQTAYPDYQQSQYQTITSLHAEGGHIFGDAGIENEGFSFQPFNLSEDFILVPGRAVTLFEVALYVSYGFDDGGNISDLVSADFSNNGRAIFCPFVQLELLTAPPSMAVA